MLAVLFSFVEVPPLIEDACAIVEGAMGCHKPGDHQITPTAQHNMTLSYAPLWLDWTLKVALPCNIVSI